MITTALKTVIEKNENLLSIVETFRALHHRQLSLPIGNRADFVRWLRCYNGGLYRLQDIRDRYLDLLPQSKFAVIDIKSKLWFDFSQPGRQSGPAVDHNLKPEYRQGITDQELKSISTLFKSLQSTNALMQEIGREFSNLFYDRIMNNYKDLRPYWFSNATAICSCFLRWTSDKPADTLPNREIVFGLTGNIRPTEFKEVFVALKRPSNCKPSKPARTRNTILGVTYAERSELPSSTLATRPVSELSAVEFLYRFNNIADDMIKAQFGTSPSDVLGNLSRTTSVKLRCGLYRRGADHVVTRWLRSYVGLTTSSVATIVTGKPETIESANGLTFYSIPAAWIDDHKIVDGRIVVYRGYNDCYHCDDGEDILDVCNRLETRVLAAETHRKNLRQQRLDVLKSLRKIKQLAVSDSYKVGNCKPGTAQFLRTIEIEPVDGFAYSKDVAIRWKRKGYPQLALFSNVVSAVVVAE